MRSSYLNRGRTAFAVALICFFSTGSNLFARNLGFLWSSQGMTHTMVLSIPDATYLHYKNKPRIQDYSRYTVEDEGYETVGAVTKALKEKATELKFSEWQTVNFIISFVQHLEYEEEQGEYPRYPAETLMEGKGDCEDTSILLSAMLQELGYDCLMLSPPAHMSVGIALTNFDGPYYPYQGQKYYYVETTGKNWKVGEIPTTYVGKADVYPLPGNGQHLQALVYHRNESEPETEGKLFVSFYRSPMGENGVYEGKKAYRYTVRLEGDPHEIAKVSEVRYRREHKTFPEYKRQAWIRRTSCQSKFASEWTGWGSVPIRVQIIYKDGRISQYHIRKSPQIASL